MFSKELEEIIEAALADGVLTDKERSVLHKRGQAEGIDPDELDVVIDGRLAKMKKSEDWLRPAPPQQLANEKLGNVVKCPNCGAPIEAGALKCAECGYVFTNVKAVRSVKAFFEEVREEFSKDSTPETRIAKISMMIRNYPIPTAKEDILEFLYMGAANCKKTGNYFSTHPEFTGYALYFAVLFILVLGTALCSNLEDFWENIIAGFVLYLLLSFWWAPKKVFVRFAKESLSGGAEKNMEHNAMANAWKAKCKQVITKARVVMKDDPSLAEVENIAKEIGF